MEHTGAGGTDAGWSVSVALRDRCSNRLVVVAAKVWRMRSMSIVKGMAMPSPEADGLGRPRQYPGDDIHLHIGPPPRSVLDKCRGGSPATAMHLLPSVCDSGTPVVYRAKTPTDRLACLPSSPVRRIVLTYACCEECGFGRPTVKADEYHPFTISPNERRLQRSGLSTSDNNYNAVDFRPQTRSQDGAELNQETLSSKLVDDLTESGACFLVSNTRIIERIKIYVAPAFACAYTVLGCDFKMTSCLV